MGRTSATRDWFCDVAITSGGPSLADINYKRNVDILRRDRDGQLAAALAAHGPLPRDVRRRRAGQRERRERGRVAHAHVRRLRPVQ